MPIDDGNRGICLLKLSLVLALAFALPGCNGPWRKPQRNYQTIPASPHHDLDTAKRETEKANQYLRKGDRRKAELHLHEALIADVTYGPAHNNLGKLYFQAGKYYLAAWEFEYAIKLMPNRPEAWNNLAMVYEAVGKLDTAIVHYENAYAMAPKNAEYLGNLTRALVRQGNHDERLRELLTEVVAMDIRPRWSHWARRELALSEFSDIGSPTIEEVLPTIDPPPPFFPTDPGRPNIQPVIDPLNLEIRPLPAVTGDPR